MLRRPPGRGPWSSQQRKLFLAFAVFLLPWIQLADAQQQHQHPSPQQQQQQQQHDTHPLPDDVDQNLSNDAGLHHHWAAASASAADIRSQPAVELLNKKQQYRVAAQRNIQKRNPHQAYESDKQPNNIKITNDASALATLAPAQPPFGAPHPSRHHRPTSSASGLTSQQIARSLEDWEVEDFVLLATVDGDLYASDRKTGRQRWHLEVDQPMVETKHYRTNNSVLDDDYNPVDHYIWAVEPNRDGGLYVWVPDAGTGLIRTPFTMKRLVEDLAPHAGDEPPVVYTGDKKTTMVTLDAATGRVLKWFGSSGSHVNEAESCLRPNTRLDKDNEECSSTGTITLGRTEYTVGIQRKDGRQIATLKYSEWSPNTFDSDLYRQYHTSLDSRYVASQHDGKVYAFDHSRTGARAPLFSQKFSVPVARVFDVCRPWGAPSGSNPELIILPQPPMPSENDSIERMRSNSIFINQTESGSWYALSGRAYPLIIDAPLAQISHPDWWDMAPAWDTLNHARLSKALVGTHYLDTVRGKPFAQPPTLPSRSLDDIYNDEDNRSNNLPSVANESIDEPTIITKVKALPQSAANSVIDFVSNPVLIILFVFSLFYNEKKLRRTYHRLRTKATVKKFYPLILNTDYELKDDVAREVAESIEAEKSALAKITDDKGASDEANESPKAKLPPSPTIEPINKSENGETSSKSAEEAQNGDQQNIASPEKKKRAHRGRRGGVKHKKGKAREASHSQDDDPSRTTVEEAVIYAKKLGDRPSLEPDIMTIHNDMQAVTGSVISMGNIEVNTEVELGMGSNGTVVFAGKFDGRDVAVKRMTIQFYDIATRETRLLRESDDHPNVIRYYSQVMRGDFLYIALERCAASLADVIEKPNFFRELATAGQRDLPGVLYQITNGISHLHSLRIVHRDLKPQNILVNMDKDGKPRLLVSDFGLCKKLEGGQSSFGATTGRAAGTSGWRAPELLLDDDGRDRGLMDESMNSGSGTILDGDNAMLNGRRATRAIDIFSLGLVYFYVLTNGSHPFDCGDRYMREVNIRKGTYNLSHLDSLGDFAYEAKDLIASMLRADPKRRPFARDVMSHPFFWSAKKRLAFLCDVSDHFEKETRDPPSPALAELESHAADITKGDFLRALPRDFVDSLGRQRKYTGTKLLDLLRALRNKRNHYEDMPESLKRSVGSLPDGYLSFWTVKFPELLLTCWNVVYNVQWEETDRFRDYYAPAGL
ncbi:Serine/threonine-protein kinase [Cladobotryum mycophilum]|uniref:non-specific serine/threonine protein kinase n=1 Tax=Cladobotryum mycophilum TaxID=491253 RepID=A0ABR0SHW7_9HYPO